ncbi:type VI secretion system baseplate subunit TssK [Roseibium denhamense]|uniref:Type VI secretion system protein ImpJ n=1 Tax=Roseibium denhamense TaxID=76305 RepID=A0ABY1NWC8_9HYPH|nr:type VI secretion system baseplate subunit TssK [Roseibium denhamense]MTI04863.1 type VI secretion system baseplate subunit TssK [Roseibium denhamense]SMP20072.1 type VI secretion system protein ImpJ [Roseibium denhamense]
MNASGKPLWLEGMFLRPQHLQQYDRWIETSLEHRVKDQLPYSWGARLIQFDPDALRIGQLQLAEADIILPDGTVFSTQLLHKIANARQITAEHQGKKIFLAVPLKTAGGLEVSDDGQVNLRYGRNMSEARNTAEADRPPANIAVGTLTARLLIEGESLDETASIPIAEIDSVDAQGAITLSETFVPPLVYLSASKRLLGQLEEIRSLLRKRGEMMAGNAAGQGSSSRGGMIDLMMLGVVNRYEILLGHLIASGRLAPEAVYRDMISLIGEIAAYGTDSRRPPEVPVYDHLDLRATYSGLVAVLRDLLSFVAEQNAVSIPLAKREYGIWLGETTDRMVYQDRSFVLIAYANVALETLRSQMPIQIKIGPVEKIRELVNLQLPGIAITPMSVAPRQIPFIQNAVYFSLDTDNNDLWPQMQNTAAFALHLSGDYPGLGLELWAIQKGK